MRIEAPGQDEDAGCVHLLKELKPYITEDEIKDMLARRDLIVAFFEAKNENSLFDRPNLSPWLT